MGSGEESDGEISLTGTRVLYISYNGMLDPLGQTQVLPYLRELSQRGVEFTLMSFERTASLKTGGSEKCKELHASLAENGIEWDWLRYHQKPSLPATVYDVLQGLRYAYQVIRRKHFDIIHARSHIPATIALGLKRRFRLKMIFDVRGLMADEYVDANHWRKSSVAYRLTKNIERRAFRSADGVVTLTQKIWPVISAWEGLAGRDVVHEVVPCCADLELFKFDPVQRAQRRRELGLANQFVIVYSGSIDGWYLTEQMADFFAVLLKQDPAVHFLWLVPGKHDRIRKLMTQRNVSPMNYSVIGVAASEVPSYLSASDAGLAFIKPCFSKLASSPTKYAEYLACGLPLIINAGIGDSDVLISEEKAGVLIHEFSETEYLKAGDAIRAFTGNAPERRDIAVRRFDLRTVGAEGYARLYENVLNHPH